MTTRFLLVVGLLVLVGATPAWSTERTKASDFATFADNGNIVVDLPGLVGALRSGADPNWLDPQRKAIRSTLEHLVLMTCLRSRDPQTDTVGLQAIKALVSAGARLQPEERGILIWPVGAGKTDIVALLLDMGADPTAWPNEEMGTPYSLVELATKKMSPGFGGPPSCARRSQT